MVHSEVLIDFQSYFSLSKNLQAPECSNKIYLKVLDKKCDDKETLLCVVNDVYEEFIVYIYRTEKRMDFARR